ncbi:PH domain-containing protein [Chryseobacterium echinoideorum]|uniref:PH domain-containing protein n=1 Tax=Chryseobacterium echinoideorum TaxID=1549648 RepID=UPI0011860A30|nr:PH domain-containing protein [Chryseobacterium echinoideorum]
MQQKFQNPQVFDIEIPDFENLEMVSVSPKYLNIILFNNALFSGFIVSAFFISYYFFGENFSITPIIALALVILILIIYIFLSSVIGFKFRKYAVRQHDLVYQYGWLKRSIIIIPFTRIQHIKVEQGWFSKILNLKSVSVYTAGVNGGDISIHGLPQEKAEEINHMIMNTISSENNEDGGEI